MRFKDVPLRRAGAAMDASCSRASFLYLLLFVGDRSPFGGWQSEWGVVSVEAGKSRKHELNA